MYSVFPDEDISDKNKNKVFYPHKFQRSARAAAPPPIVRYPPYNAYGHSSAYPAPRQYTPIVPYGINGNVPPPRFSRPYQSSLPPQFTATSKNLNCTAKSILPPPRYPRPYQAPPQFTAATQNLNSVAEIILPPPPPPPVLLSAEALDSANASSTVENGQHGAIDAVVENGSINAETNIQSNVGDSFIEYLQHKSLGNFFNYYCSLCGCSMNNTREIDQHINGRRHLLALLKVPVVPNSSTVENGQHGAADAAVGNGSINAETNIQSNVEDSFIEYKYNSKGKFINYYCSLCGCSMKTPREKDQHINGQRHRLALSKVKVVPKLEAVPKSEVESLSKIEINNNGILPLKRHQKNRENEKIPKKIRVFAPLPPLSVFRNYVSDAEGFSQWTKNPNDKYIIQKYYEIRMNDTKLTEVMELADIVENALKYVSVRITGDDFEAPKPPMKEVKEEVNEISPYWIYAKDPPIVERIIRVIMQVGNLAYRILMNDDRQVDIVVLSTLIPTKRLLNKMIQLLPDGFRESLRKFVTITPVHDKAGFLINIHGYEIQFRITLTCQLMREYEDAPAELPKDSLPLLPCLAALTELRREKWYNIHARIKDMHICVIVLRYIRQKLNEWKPVTSWMLSILVYKVYEMSIGCSLSPGDVLQIIFEVISSEIFLNNNNTDDPCERNRDLLESLTVHQRISITASARHVYRLINRGEIYKLLDMEKIEEKEAVSTEEKPIMMEIKEKTAEEVPNIGERILETISSQEESNTMESSEEKEAAEEEEVLKNMESYETASTEEKPIMMEINEKTAEESNNMEGNETILYRKESNNMENIEEKTLSNSTS